MAIVWEKKTGGPHPTRTAVPVTTAGVTDKQWPQQPRAEQGGEQGPAGTIPTTAPGEETTLGTAPDRAKIN